MSTVIIFGAGASIDRTSSLATPPLTSDLATRLAEFDSKGWGQLPSHIRLEMQNDFELGMERLWKEYSHIVAELQIRLAAFFYRFEPTERSLYYQFARRIHAGHSISLIATLNYERLLEISLRAARIGQIIGGPPTNSSMIELCLPHGCCHLYSKAVSAARGMVQFHPGAVQINGQPEVARNPEEFQRYILNSAFPPIMSYITSDKPTTAGVSFLSEQKRRLAQAIESASKVVIVGVRVRERDEHIWGPVSNTSAHVYYCAPEPSASEFLSWCDRRRSFKESQTLEGTFEGQFEAICNLVI